MDDLSPGARALLRAADTYDDPSADDAARVRRAVLTRVGAIGLTAAVVTASSTQAKAASITAIAAKLSAAVALTVGGVAAWTFATAPETPPVSAPAPVTARGAEPAQTPRPEAPAPVEAPLLDADKLAVEELPKPKAPRQPGPALPEKPEPAKTEPSPADLEAEMKLIRAADAAVRAGRSSEALSLLGQHQAAHARGSLSHEREGLRALAQCQLGSPGALATATRFIERSPRSPLAGRLRGACRISE
jgi:hypothetical protein